MGKPKKSRSKKSRSKKSRHWDSDFQFSTWGEIAMRRRSTATRDGLSATMLKAAGVKLPGGTPYTDRWYSKTNKILKSKGVSESGSGCGLGHCDVSFNVKSCAVAMRMKKAAMKYAKKHHALGLRPGHKPRVHRKTWDGHIVKLRKCPRGRASRKSY